MATSNLLHWLSDKSPAEAKPDPFRALWAEVMRRAIMDLCGLDEELKRFHEWKKSNPAPRQPRRSGQTYSLYSSAEQQRAQEWFESDELYVGSFVYICGVLDLPIEAVRDRLANRQFDYLLINTWRIYKNASPQGRNRLAEQKRRYRTRS